MALDNGKYIKCTELGFTYRSGYKCPPKIKEYTMLLKIHRYWCRYTPINLINGVYVYILPYSVYYE